ncbi:MAG: ABC transporter permease [Chloroflexi bacterium]|nr:ABC transporter permease [Chloroflexota bacterium]
MQKSLIQTKFWKSVPPVVWVVLLMLIFFGVAAPGFFTVRNIISIVLQGSVLLMVSVAATFVLLSEGIDLSLGSLLTLSGVMAALSLQAGAPFLVAIAVGILTGVVCGAVTGALVAFAKLPPFIATLGMQGMAGGLAVVLTSASAIYIEAPEYVHLGGGTLGIIPMPAIIALLVFVGSWIVLYHTSFGRYVISIGGNENGSRLSGVSTNWWKFAIYVFAGALTAIGGVVMSARLQSAEPLVGVGWEFDAIAATVLGGTSFERGNGSVGGTVIGVALIAVLRNGLNFVGLTTMWQPAVIGVVIISAIVFDVMLKRRGTVQ